MRWNEIINETSTAGASASGNVATSIGGIGAGFDPNGDWGIYNSSKPKVAKAKKRSIIRR